jgi:hypothetical protein
VALLITVLAIAAAIAVVLITRGDDDGSGQTGAPAAQQQQQQPQNQQSTPPPIDAAVRDDVAAIGDILDLSAKGRALTAGGDFQGAAENRRQVLTQVDALSVDPQLTESHSVLRNAIQASLDSNVAHRNCGDCAPARAADTRATQLKAQFARVFNPFAERYLQRSYDPSKF